MKLYFVVVFLGEGEGEGERGRKIKEGGGSLVVWDGWG